MRTILAFLFLFVLIGNAQAQNQIGISGGINFPVYKQDFDPTHMNSALTAAPSYNLNGLFALKINQRYHLHFGLGFDKRTYETSYFSGDALGFSSDTGTTHLSFGNFSVINQFKVFQKHQLFIGIGVSIGKLFTMHEIGTHSSGTLPPNPFIVNSYSYDRSTKDTNFSDKSLLLTSSYQFKLNKRFSILCEAMYKHSFNFMDITAQSNYFALSFRDFRLNVGLLVALSKKTKTTAN